jgi:hypothetical protein
MIPQFTASSPPAESAVSAPGGAVVWAGGNILVADMESPTEKKLWSRIYADARRSPDGNGTARAAIALKSAKLSVHTRKK